MLSRNGKYPLFANKWNSTRVEWAMCESTVYVQHNVRIVPIESF